MGSNPILAANRRAGRCRRPQGLAGRDRWWTPGGPVQLVVSDLDAGQRLGRTPWPPLPEAYTPKVVRFIFLLGNSTTWSCHESPWAAVSPGHLRATRYTDPGAVGAHGRPPQPGGSDRYL